MTSASARRRYLHDTLLGFPTFYMLSVLLLLFITTTPTHASYQLVRGSRLELSHVVYALVVNSSVAAGLHTAYDDTDASTRRSTFSPTPNV